MPFRTLNPSQVCRRDMTQALPTPKVPASWHSSHASSPGIHARSFRACARPDGNSAGREFASAFILGLRKLATPFLAHEKKGAAKHLAQFLGSCPKKGLKRGRHLGCQACLKISELPSTTAQKGDPRACWRELVLKAGGSITSIIRKQFGADLSTSLGPICWL